MPVSPLTRPRPDDPSGPPPLRSVAEVLHRSCAGRPGPVLTHVVHEPPRSLSIGLWPVPDRVDHPADPLIGFVAPARWSAVGLTTTGRLRSLDDPAPTPEPVAITVLADRTGATASVIEGPGSPLQVLEEPPEGWAADALARVLGRPTPPPVESPARWVESLWLDRLAAGLLPHPAPHRPWRWLADRHPLAGTRSPSPTVLARRTTDHGRSHPWSVLRGDAVAAGRALLGPNPVHPPGAGAVVPLDRWFDDGSYARWQLRRLPPADLLLPDLLAVLSPERGHDLLAALTTLSAP